MATFTQDAILGDTGNFLGFVTNTRVYNHGSGTATVNGALANQDLTVNGTAGTPVSVTADGITVLTRNLLGNINGTIRVRNGGSINLISGAGVNIREGAIDVNLDWDDFTVVGDLDAYSFHGAFNTPGSPLFNIRNGSFLLNVNQVDFTEQYYLFFAGSISSASTISNVSFWNGEMGVRGKGGVPGLTTTANYSGLTLGPAGLWTNSAPALIHERNIIRFANQGAAGVTASNTLCWMGNLDFRALSGITTTNAPTSPVTSGDELRSWVIVADSNAHAWLVNPYVGRPTLSGTGLGNGRLAFTGYFGTGGRIRTFSATNPVKNGAGARTYALDQFTVNDGVYIVPATIPSGINVTQPAALGARTIKDTGTGINGILFQQQFFQQSAASGNNNNIGERILFRQFTDKSYRVYDWLEQPSNVQFGDLRTLTAPVEGATDAQLATAIENGYDTFDSGFTTSTDVIYPDDLPVIDSGLTEITVLARRDATGSKNSDELAAISKSISWEEAQSPDTTNTKINLLHSYVGARLRFTRDVMFDAGTTIPLTNSTTAANNIDIVFRASEITITDLLTSVSTLGALTINDGFGASTATNKVGFNAESTTFQLGTSGYRNLVISGEGVIQAGTNTYENNSFTNTNIPQVQNPVSVLLIQTGSTFTGNTMNDIHSIGTTAIPIMADDTTLSNNTYTGTSAFVFSTAQPVISVEEILGTGYTVATGSTVNLASNAAVNVGVDRDAQGTLVLPTGVAHNAATSNITLVENEIRETITLAAPTSGFYAVHVLDAGGDPITPRLVNRETILAGIGKTITLSSNDYADGDVIQFVFKFNSTIQGDVYQEQKINHIFGSGSTSLAIIPPEINVALTNGATTPSRRVDSSGVATPGADVTFVETAVNNTFDISNATTRLSNLESQGTVIEFANQAAYFDAYLTDSGTAPLVTYAADASVQWRGNVFTFQSGELTPTNITLTNGNAAIASLPRLQLFANWGSGPDQGYVVTNDRGSGIEVNSVDSPNALLSTVVEAARIGIDNSGVSANLNYVALGNVSVLPRAETLAEYTTRTATP